MGRIVRGVLVAGWMSAAVMAQGQPMPQRTAQQKPEQKVYRIAGRLTNSVTGEAVAGATMTLQVERPRVMIQQPSWRGSPSPVVMPTGRVTTHRAGDC